MNTLKLLFAISVLLLVSACGGGGGGSNGPVTSTETFQLKTAYVNTFNDVRSLPFTISGTVSGESVTGSGMLTLSTPTRSTFESITALQKNSVMTMNITIKGVTASVASSDSSFVDSNYTPLGSNSNEYVVVTNNVAILTIARVGDSGTWTTSNRYTNNTKTSLLGTRTVTYVLEPDTSATALLKIIETDKDRSGATERTEIITYRITPVGEITYISDSIAESDSYVTAKF